MPSYTPRSTVTIPDGCHDDVVPLFDRRAEPLVSVGITQVAVSSLVAGFEWPGPHPQTHLVLATIDGRGRLLAADREHELMPGTVAVCPAHVNRRHWAEEPWRVVTIRIAATEQWHALGVMGPFVLDGQDPYRFAAPALGILGELPRAMTVVSGASVGRDPLDAFLDRFGAQLNVDPSAAGPSVPTDPFALYAVALRIQLEGLLAGPPSISEDERRLARLWEAVRREPGCDWSVDVLARHLSVSRATLHRLVDRHHDSGPAAIVERIRMDHAAHLLAHGSLPIKAIASQVGYSTPYSFSVAFRRARGCPPSKFRERIAESPSMESTADQQAGGITRRRVITE